ncbi:hypothetical protein KAT92_06810 [Candidatus Babeliales bacterium]|nr:hypothetical protein [Candidatus Babeliales bacterium]
MKQLLKILSHRRSYGSEGESKIIVEELDTVKGMTSDNFGNRMITVGSAKPHILFSSHTDTVHGTRSWRAGKKDYNDKDGDIMQKIVVDKIKFEIFKDDKECLGADDGAGMWLMLKMITAGVPGLYIFHRGEEVGGLGSDYIIKETPEVLAGIDIAIAFDRRGNKDIITHQGGSMCCSQDFAQSLGEQLCLGHAPNSGGSFTDTANYTDIIAECTNVACGYTAEHSARETLDYKYLIKLKRALLGVNWSKIAVKRKPGEDDRPVYSGWRGHRSSLYDDYDDYNGYGVDPMRTYHELLTLATTNPALAARIMYIHGTYKSDVTSASRIQTSIDNSAKIKKAEAARKKKREAAACKRQNAKNRHTHGKPHNHFNGGVGVPTKPRIDVKDESGQQKVLPFHSHKPSQTANESLDGVEAKA